MLPGAAHHISLTNAAFIQPRACTIIRQATQVEYVVVVRSVGLGNVLGFVLLHDALFLTSDPKRKMFVFWGESCRKGSPGVVYGKATVLRV